MRVKFDLRKLRETSVGAYVLRFAFGGIVAAVAGWVGDRFGAPTGGLFLAFPALLPASLTLVKEHDGRRSAYDDARGAALGAIGMCCFALVVGAVAERLSPPVSLLLALGAWVGASSALWWWVFGRQGAPARPAETHEGSDARGA